MGLKQITQVHEIIPQLGSIIEFTVIDDGIGIAEFLLCDRLMTAA